VLPGHFRHARVALLSTWHPEPVDNGRKQRTRIIIDALSSEHEVILISLVDPATATGTRLPEVPGVAAQFQLPLPVFEARALAGLHHAFSRLPRSIVATWSPETSRQINQILSSYQVAAAIGTDLRTLRYLTSLPSCIARILDEPDVSPFVNASGASRGRLRARARKFKYRGLLDSATRRLDAVAVASARESEAFRALSGATGSVIANVVPALPRNGWCPTSNAALLYTGALTYAPNLAAVEFLVRDVLAAIAPEYPDLQLTVTGSVPVPEPAIASHPLVNLTGNTPSLDSYYRNSRLFVIPLQAGTGTRIKLLEAMSYGMPIVSTRKGAEGLPVVDGKHLLLADSANELIGAILLLLEDRDLSSRLGTSARKLVAERFTAKAVDDVWRQLVADAIAQRQERGGDG
jgi:glycosyltransferase involved in cell wall biosynthesis